MSKYIWPPFTSIGRAYNPIKLVRGAGAYVYDEYDKRYFDAISSWWVNAHGHAHPIINEAINRQMQALEHCIFADFTHDPAEHLAENLAPRLPLNNPKIFFSDNGSTSVEVAIKMAIQAKHQQGEKSDCILGLKNAYHGDTFGAMSAAQNPTFFAAFQPYLFDVLSIDLETDPINEAALDRLIGQRKVAALVYEPLVQGAGGMRMPAIEHYNLLLNYCRKRGIYLIADEVMTGFGRTGSLFASEQLDIKPDILCLSKCLTGGYLPMGLSCADESVWEAFNSSDSSKTFYHGHSYTANPLACAAANASLALSTSETGVKQRQMIAQSFTEIGQKLKKEERVYNLRQRGCILAFEIMHSEAGYHSPLTAQVKSEALKRGLLLRPLGNTLYFIPPFVSQKQELEYLADACLEIICQL